jgi:hypothetical protein
VFFVRFQKWVYYIKMSIYVKFILLMGYNISYTDKNNY